MFWFEIKPTIHSVGLKINRAGLRWRTDTITKPTQNTRGGYWIGHFSLYPNPLKNKNYVQQDSTHSNTSKIYHPVQNYLYVSNTLKILGFYGYGTQSFFKMIMKEPDHHEKTLIRELTLRSINKVETTILKIFFDSINRPEEFHSDSSQLYV